MLLKDLILFEDKYYVMVNTAKDKLFYFLDYGKRSSDINMQFPHFHTFYEMCVVLSPKAGHVVEGKPYDLQEFDIIGIPPNRLHKSQYPEGDPCKRIIIRFNLPKHVDGLSNEYEKLLEIFHQPVPIFRFTGELRKRVCRRLNDIFLLGQSIDPMKNLKIHMKFIEFLSLLHDNQNQNAYFNGSDMNPTEEKIYAISSFIHTHYQEELSLDMLAQEFYISNCYLSHQFKDVTGFTLTDYIQITRIRNVESMLINTNTPITEIALQCGFTSFSQFNRVFQKHVGMSPSAYRKNNSITAAV